MQKGWTFKIFNFKERTLAAIWEEDWKGRDGGRKTSLEAIANIHARAAKGRDGELW